MTERSLEITRFDRDDLDWSPGVPHLPNLADQAQYEQLIELAQGVFGVSLPEHGRFLGSPVAEYMQTGNNRPEDAESGKLMQQLAASILPITGYSSDVMDVLIARFEDVPRGMASFVEHSLGMKTPGSLFLKNVLSDPDHEYWGGLLQIDALSEGVTQAQLDDVAAKINEMRIFEPVHVEVHPEYRRRSLARALFQKQFTGTEKPALTSATSSAPAVLLAIQALPLHVHALQPATEKNLSLEYRLIALALQAVQVGIYRDLYQQQMDNGNDQLADHYSEVMEPQLAGLGYWEKVRGGSPVDASDNSEIARRSRRDLTEREVQILESIGKEVETTQVVYVAFPEEEM